MYLSTLSIIQKSSDLEQARKIISTSDTTKHIMHYIIQHIEVICLNRQGNQGLAPCTLHEDADIRMLTPNDAVQHGHNKVLIRTVDITDVVLL